MTMDRIYAGLAVFGALAVDLRVIERHRAVVAEQDGDRCVQRLCAVLVIASYKGVNQNCREIA
jgi:hypothetical protein